ncbi:hypothetical protein [Natronoflexus pectinivorans]|uniref:Leucine rich repeat (LRR) protein n=1 Tax=Natronoflexus pectinivorans TaxID=682526 RepID=A0A4V2RWK6_9BACT|nr:hypothetical protein [Natronoflexus pectinivorans]TCO08848.1 hypothetical protein EV194_104159 [Natronoflexus pectinivorans]
MKRLSFKLLITLLGVILMTVLSCSDDDKPNDVQTEAPLLGQNFDFVVDGNRVTFTTTLSGNVWFTNLATEADHTVTDGSVAINLPLAGVYEFTCSRLADGVTLTSDVFDVVIEQDDLDFLNEGMWYYLSGGANETKTWRMDINEDGKTVYFDGPLYYSGLDGNPYWAWDILEEELPVVINGTEMSSFFNWSPDYASNTWIMAPKNYGTITFNATAGTISTDRFGEICNSTFAFDPETMKLTIPSCIIPIDTGRVNEGQFSDLQNLRIFTLTEHSMQIGVKRTYEDGEDSPWTHVYNFVVVGHEYAREEFTYSEPVNTSFTQEDLVGTWKFADVAQDWIGWRAEGDWGTIIEPRRLNGWSTRAEMVATLASWGAEDAEDIFNDGDTREFVFNADGTCVLAGNDNTYSVSDGVITFSEPLDEEFSLVWIGLSGTEVKVLDVVNDDDGNPYSYDGIWIGQQNDQNKESKAVKLVKVED